MIKIKIDGVEYKNIGTIETEIVPQYNYDVITLDGKRHREKVGERTNYKIVFFNDNLISYDLLKKKLKTAETVLLEIPTGADNYIADEFLVRVNNDTLKGLMYDGNWYNTALSVDFEKVNYDE